MKESGDAVSSMRESQPNRVESKMRHVRMLLLSRWQLHWHNGWSQVEWVWEKPRINVQVLWQRENEENMNSLHNVTILTSLD